MKFLLLGNPNVGKTSLFNHITGSSARVGNYPGVTIERRFAPVTISEEGKEYRVNLSDTPGTYSLSARSSEEQIALRALLGQDGQAAPDVAIVVVNATQLSRNLYLACQVLELGIPTVIALSMLDEAEPHPPDPAALSAELGVPVVTTNGNTGAGTQELLSAALRLSLTEKPFVPRLRPQFDSSIRKAADRVAAALPEAWKGSVERDRALALWALMSLDDDDELLGVPQELRRVVKSTTDELGDFDLAIVEARYRAVDSLLKRVLTSEARAHAGGRRHFTERFDRVLLHPIWGFLIFMATMLVVFQALFSWADPAIGWIEELVTTLQDLANTHLPEGLMTDLLVNGVLGGVGNVVVFLPQILLLFLFIGLLEDSGYMARIAYLMDRVMRSLGLHGRAFVPMLSGFACAIPAIMATRTLERRRDQLLTMMVIPLMTCSARLPVYTLVIGALFPAEEGGSHVTQSLLMAGLYLFSVVTALVAAAVLSRTVIRGKSMPLLLELPPYRIPRLTPTLRMMKVRAGQFLKEAGTTILVATIVLWGLLSFPRVGPAESGALAVHAAAQDGPTVTASAAPTSSGALGAPPALADSYAGRMSRALEPVMAPLGFDWKITTGIVGAFAAREVFVSTLGLVFGLEEMDEEALPLRERIQNEKDSQGNPKYTPLMGLSLLIFFALACQCVSTLAVVRRETASYRWPLFLFGYMTFLAYFCSLAVFQIGKLLGY